MAQLRVSPLEQPTWKLVVQSRLFRVQLYIAMFFAIIAVPITYCAFDNQRPYEFFGEQSLVIPDPATPGDQMLVKWRVRVNRICAGTIRRFLVDPATGVSISYDPQIAAGKAELVDGYLNKTFTLPRGIHSGWWRYRSDLEYSCNPLQRIWPLRYSTPELMFKVQP